MDVPLQDVRMRVFDGLTKHPGDCADVFDCVAEER